MKRDQLQCVILRSTLNRELVLENFYLYVALLSRSCSAAGLLMNICGTRELCWCSADAAMYAAPGDKTYERSTCMGKRDKDVWAVPFSPYRHLGKSGTTYKRCMKMKETNYNTSWCMRCMIHSYVCGTTYKYELMMYEMYEHERDELQCQRGAWW